LAGEESDWSTDAKPPQSTGVYPTHPTALGELAIHRHTGNPLHSVLSRPLLRRFGSHIEGQPDVPASSDER
jgi:hypothetical protein